MSNLALRTVTSVVFTAVMVAGIIISPYIYGGLFLVIMVVALQEFFRMTIEGRFMFQQKCAIAAAALMFMFVLFWRMDRMDPEWTALAILPLLAIPVSFIFRKDHTDFGMISYLYAGILYIALPLTLTPFMVIQGGEFNGFVLLSIFVIIWLCDVGAYTIGTLLGQKPTSRKLAPSISPKKSWWGFWGGLTFGAIAAVVLHFVGWLPYSIVHCIVLGAIVSASGVCGDLVESLWKRYIGVKDSGNCIPGHGGMLDRFDSSLLAIPVAFIYMIIFNLI